MTLSKNLQDNSTRNSLKYGISDYPVIEYSSNPYNILNLQESNTSVTLYEGKQYYFGAINRLTWRESGYSKIVFSKISF